MPDHAIRRLRNGCESAAVGALAALPAWFSLLSVVRLDTSGVWGMVTVVVWSAYLFGVPVLVVAGLWTAVLAAMRGYASTTRLIVDVMLLLGVAGLYYWSFSARVNF